MLTKVKTALSLLRNPRQQSSLEMTGGSLFGNVGQPGVTLAAPQALGSSLLNVLYTPAEVVSSLVKRGDHHAHVPQRVVGGQMKLQSRL